MPSWFLPLLYLLTTVFINTLVEILIVRDAKNLIRHLLLDFDLYVSCDFLGRKIVDEVV